MIKNQINTSELIAENQRYVELVAKQYLDQGLTLEQLIEAGNRGLAEAAKRFDSSKGHSFMSYAVWWVRQGILQALANHSSGKSIPLSERERSIQQDIDEGRLLADIAKEWSLTERRVQQIHNRSVLKTINNV
ncbi:MAG: hypothetical protein J6Q60_08495 [Bacteroidaceae bacterium]|nr:hypothetical protein [Bacteroidaceae bacterium]